jgi:CMP/dCMP kinase
MGASTVSAHKAVRDALLEMQRQAGRAGGVVLEGRDIGTVVFPDADVKFFLTARPEVRARRRFDELVAKGSRTTFEETLEDVQRRDDQDTTRAVAPLRQAPDATLVDSSEIGVDEAVARMAARVRARAQG